MRSRQQHAQQHAQRARGHVRSAASTRMPRLVAVAQPLSVRIDQPADHALESVAWADPLVGDQTRWSEQEVRPQQQRKAEEDGGD
jgi:hypothetical protein